MLIFELDDNNNDEKTISNNHNFKIYKHFFPSYIQQLVIPNLHTEFDKVNQNKGNISKTLSFKAKYFRPKIFGFEEEILVLCLICFQF